MQRKTNTLNNDNIIICVYNINNNNNNNNIYIYTYIYILESDDDQLSFKIVIQKKYNQLPGCSVNNGHGIRVDQKLEEKCDNKK